MSHKKATRILIAGGGTQWDSKMLDAFLEAEARIDNLSPPVKLWATDLSG
jgi:HD-GYP domain-containing protein (c-di-GMP phosphodiesterase class II)